MRRYFSTSAVSYPLRDEKRTTLGDTSLTSSSCVSYHRRCIPSFREGLFLVLALGFRLKKVMNFPFESVIRCKDTRARIEQEQIDGLTDRHIYI